jgi:hypothetical protein
VGSEDEMPKKLRSRSANFCRRQIFFRPRHNDEPYWPQVLLWVGIILIALVVSAILN